QAVGRACLRALAAILFCGGLPAANLLTVTPGSVALSCNTAGGPGPAAAIVVKPVASLAANTIPVTAVALGAGLVVTPPAPASLSSANQSQGLTFTVNVAAGCAGASSGSFAIRFYAGGVADAAVTAAVSVTAATSPLTVTPVVLTCVRNAGPPVTYTPGPAQAVTVISGAAGGTPFTVDPSTIPAWLSVTPRTGGIADLAGVTYSIAAAAPCGNYAAGSNNSASIHLRNLPAPDGLIPVALRILGPPPVAAMPASPALSYAKGSGSPVSVDVALTTSAPTAVFAVDATTLPAWLSVDVSGGALPASLHFTTTAAADALATGTYGAVVHVQVSGYSDLALPFRLTVADPPPKLTVAEGTTRNLTWTVGQPLPIPFITVTSSGTPLPYSIVTGGPLAPSVGSGFANGFAYSYATPIPVTFSPSVFAAAQPGSVLTGTVSIAWGSPATTTAVTFNVSAQSAAAVLQAVSPLTLPTATPGQTFTVALSGAGFVASSDATQRTVAGIVSGGSLVADPNVTAAAVNSSTIILTITAPVSADPLLPFDPAGAGGTVVLGVCNPLGAACTTPTGTATLTIGAAPVILAATSASAFRQVAAPALPVVAPYDIVSLFGINFCTARGTGCGDAILYGTPDPSTQRYPAALSPDDAGSSQRLLTVTFQTQGGSPAAIGNAPLLVATNGQINLLAPSALSAFAGKSVDVMVTFGGTSSAPFAVLVAATDPGIFTIGAAGTGDAAALGSDGTPIAAGNPAGMRQNAADSDVVEIFVTGLGSPDGIADNATSGKGAWPADCVSAASFLKSLDSLTSTSFNTLDGAVVSSGALSAGRLAPCLRSPGAVPTVTIGGQPGLVAYAGWVPDSVVGAYQLNVRLPGSGAGPFTTATGTTVAGPLTAPVQLPVVMTAGGRATQAGVTLWVTSRLKVTGPAGAALRGTAGAAWPAAGSQVSAGEGTAPYQYAVTAGSLPAGLTLNPATGAMIGTPAAGSAGSYPVTVTATDSAAAPVTGNATFTLTVAAGH
ncbi:MAG TPA: putative Ig domain-containing protein, partial [Candidatus Sulfopaludibacter sp.]|nr:putative Ig domain-containing protein [Candidatus Sulfopaludibacter sp.]